MATAYTSCWNNSGTGSLMYNIAFSPMREKRTSQDRIPAVHSIHSWKFEHWRHSFFLKGTGVGSTFSPTLHFHNYQGFCPRCTGLGISIYNPHRQRHYAVCLTTIRQVAHYSSIWLSLKKQITGGEVDSPPEYHHCLKHTKGCLST